MYSFTVSVLDKSDDNKDANDKDDDDKDDDNKDDDDNYDDNEDADIKDDDKITTSNAQEEWLIDMVG